MHPQASKPWLVTFWVTVEIICWCTSESLTMPPCSTCNTHLVCWGGLVGTKVDQAASEGANDMPRGFHIQGWAVLPHEAC